MKNISTDTWVRTGVLIFALVNQILTTLGINPLPFSEEDVYSTLTVLITAVATVWGFWKNNSFTAKAIQADEYLDELKNGEDE